MSDLDDQAEDVRTGRGRQSGGASNDMQDARVSRGITWVLGIIGSLLVVALCFCANNLWQLNLTMRDVLTQNKTTVAQLSDHELRLRQVERSISTIEGRNLRGGPQQEVPRGR